MKKTGIEPILQHLEQLKERAQQLQGKHQVPLAELIPESFIQPHYNFKTLQEMFDASGLQQVEDFNSEIGNEFIAKNTSFAGWNEMLDSASREWIKRQLSI